MLENKQLQNLANKVDSDIYKALGMREGPDLTNYVYPALVKAYQLGRQDAQKEKESKVVF